MPRFIQKYVRNIQGYLKRHSQQTFKKKICTQLPESYIQYDTSNVRIKQLKEEVKATLIACGHCDLRDLLPYLEVGNQDQIVVLQLILQWVFPNGTSC